MNLEPISMSGVKTPSKQHVAGERRYLLEHLGNNEFAFLIDNSSLEAFLVCARAGEYKLVKGKVNDNNAALNFGRAIHDGLETWYLNAKESFRLDKAKKAIIARMLDCEVGPNEYRTVERALRVMELYALTYKHEPWKLAMSPENAVENAFCLKVGEIETDAWFPFSVNEIVGPGVHHPWDGVDATTGKDQFFISKLHIYWTGRMDLLINWDGEYWVLDHKTTKMGGETFWDDYMINQQMTGYTWAARELFGLPFRGAVINQLLVRQPTQKDPLGVNEFARMRFTYSDDAIAEWKQDIMALIETFITYLAKGYFPKMTKWCFGKYGKCKYHDVCQVDPSRRDFVLSLDNFHDFTWSPLQEDKPKIPNAQS